MSNDDVQQPTPVYSIHEGIVFIIELTDSMVFPDPISGKSHLQVILESLSESMNHSVITLPNTGYGVYLFNSSKTSKGLPSGIERLFDLKDVNYYNMKKIQDILEENQNLNSDIPYIPIEERFKPSLEVTSVNPLDDVLRVAQDDLLIKKEYQNAYTNKRIFLFTDNDKPIDDSNVQQRNILRNTRNNLEDGYITITPFFISTEFKPFNESFYKELMTLSVAKNLDGDDFNLDDETIFDGPNSTPIDVKYIKERILRRKEIKRKQFEIPFILNDDLIISTKGYVLYSQEEAKRSKFLYETAEYRKNVYSRRRFIDEKTGYEFEKTTKVFKFGNGDDDVFELTSNDFEKLSTYNENYPNFLKLIGFKDEKLSVKLQYQIGKSSSFLVPDENSIEGSTRTLSSLYKSLTKLKKCGILFGKLRKGSQPNFYVLQATKAPFPQGFFLIKLPFFDDIRQFPNDYNLNENPSEQLVRISKLILITLKLKNGYRPSDFKNPNLQQHYKILHDFLLQVEQNEEEDQETRLNKDDTLKRIHQIRQRIEESQLDPNNKDKLFNYIKEWNELYQEYSI